MIVENIVITEQGKQLMSKVISETESMTFTKIAVSDYDYSGIELQNISELQSVKQTAIISKTSRTDGKTVEILAAINNEQIPESYYVRTLGVYVKDSSENEILYGISISGENPDYMPAYEGKTLSGVSYRINVAVEDSEYITVNVNPAAVPTIMQVEDIETALREHTEDKVSHITAAERKKWDAVTEKVNANLIITKNENITMGGAVWESKPDGTFIVSGECTNPNIIPIDNNDSGFFQSLAGKTVTVSGGTSKGVYIMLKIVVRSGSGTVTNSYPVYEEPVTVNVPSNILSIFLVGITTPGTYEDVYIAPKVEFGTEATAYTPYTGGDDYVSANAYVMRDNIERLYQSKVDQDNIVNNLVTTKEGYALDARQGEALDGKITELKKSVSDGKSAIASAITNEGVSTASDASFDTMVESIGKIFYKRLGTQLPKYYYANVHATSGSNGEQRIYRNAGTTTKGNWIGHEEFFGGALPNLRGCIIITWLRGINAYTIMRLKSSFLGEDEFETLYECSLRYYHPDGGTIILNSSAVTPGVEICTLCLACHS